MNDKKKLAFGLLALSIFITTATAGPIDSVTDKNVAWKAPRYATCDWDSCYIDFNVTNTGASIIYDTNALKVSNNLAIKDFTVFIPVEHTGTKNTYGNVERTYKCNATIGRWTNKSKDFFYCYDDKTSKVLFNDTEARYDNLVTFTYTTYDVIKTEQFSYTTYERASGSKSATTNAISNYRIYFNVPHNSVGKFDVELTFLRGGLSYTTKIDPWWNTTWKYYQNITLNNGGATTRTNYQVIVNLNSTNHGANFNWNNQCKDVRFATTTGTLLNYWQQYCTYTAENATFYVNVSSIPAGTSVIRMYYGNSSPVSSASNGNRTFIRFDDFTGSVLSSNWTVIASCDGVGGYSTANWGTLILYKRSIWTTYNASVNTSLLTRFRKSVTGAGRSGSSGYGIYHDSCVSYNNDVIHIYTVNAIRYPITYNGTASAGDWFTPASELAWDNITIIRNGSNSVIFKAPARTDDRHTSNIPTKNIPIGAGARHTPSSSSYATFEFDYFALSKYQWPQVSATLGSETSGIAPTLTWNWTRNTSSQFPHTLNITVKTNIAKGGCKLQINNTNFTMSNKNSTYSWYSYTPAAGNWTYKAYCNNSNSGVWGNINAAWYKITDRILIRWEWSRNATSAYPHALNITLNTTPAFGTCRLQINSTNVTMIKKNSTHAYYNYTPATGNWTYRAYCNSSATGLWNSTYQVWYRISAQTNLTTYCPSRGYVNIPFVIAADYTEGSSDILGATVTVTSGLYNGSLSYNNATGKYQDSFESNYSLIWNITINASKTGYQSRSKVCSIRIYNGFNLTVKLWEQVEAGIYANTTYYIKTQQNYNKQLVDPYINDFAWILAKSNGLNATGVYTYCNIPFGPAQTAEGLLNIGNWMSSNLSDGLKGYVGCTDYWLRGQYQNGEAELYLPDIGEYDLYLLEGTMTFENDFSPPKIMKSNLFIPLGKIKIDTRQNQTVNYWIPHSEINFWGNFSDIIFGVMVFILPALMFLAGMLLRLPLQLIGIIIILWELGWFGKALLGF